MVFNKKQIKKVVGFGLISIPFIVILFGIGFLIGFFKLLLGVLIAIVLLGALVLGVNLID